MDTFTAIKSNTKKSGQELSRPDFYILNINFINPRPIKTDTNVNTRFRDSGYRFNRFSTSMHKTTHKRNPKNTG